MTNIFSYLPVAKQFHRTSVLNKALREAIISPGLTKERKKLKIEFPKTLPTISSIEPLFKFTNKIGLTFTEKKFNSGDILVLDIFFCEAI